MNQILEVLFYFLGVWSVDSAYFLQSMAIYVMNCWNRICIPPQEWTVAESRIVQNGNWAIICEKQFTFASFYGLCRGLKNFPGLFFISEEKNKKTNKYENSVISNSMINYAPLYNP